MKKTLLISLITLLALLSVMVFAATQDIFLGTPENNGVAFNNITFTGEVGAGEGRNVSNVSLWTNSTGVWSRNLTNSTFARLRLENGAVFDYFFRSNNLPDGTNVVWAIEIATNTTTDGNVANFTMSPNRTVTVEVIPTIALVSPANFANLSGQFNFSFTPSTTSAYIANLTCDVFTNNTNNVRELAQRVDLITPAFNTNVTLFPAERDGVGVSVTCFERADSRIFAIGANRTYNIDRTAPVGTMTPDFSNNASATGNVDFNITFDSKVAGIVFYTNQSATFTQNKTIARVFGSSVNFTLQNLNEGSYTVGGYLWDYAGNNRSLTNYTFVVDESAPAISAIVNVSGVGALNTVQITWTTDDNANGSVSYGTTVAATSSQTETASLITSHAVNISGLTELVTYFYNITSCNVAGLCNFTAGQNTINGVSGIYAGWNAYGLFRESQTMGEIYNNSRADYVYWWNSTSQSWVGHTGGTGSQASTLVFGGDVIWLFKSTNGTWLRSLVNAGPGYRRNLTNGINFVNAQFNYNFTNLTTTFTNITTNTLSTAHRVGGNADGTGGQGVDVSQVEYYGMYNNTDQTYTSHFRNDTFNNITYIPRGFAVYIGTPLNITWNGTKILANWTVT